ncbi:MAG: bacteriohemerythrin [Archaeoglobaceae archaeon]|nr:bacteriohemerythrin [Archaeoglobaceae archaeon]MDW8128394.1 bacteriohemerythrin [Archaeoglobaceae archaeon]
MKWDDSFSVGVQEIDSQHKKLVEMLGSLISEMKKGQGRIVIGKTIEEMMNYAKVHFATEEKYMTLYNYPNSTSHKKEHEKFIESAKNFYENYMKGNLTAVELMNFLRNWLLEHILDSDKNLGKFVCEVSLCKQ